MATLVMVGTMAVVAVFVPGGLAEGMKSWMKSSPSGPPSPSYLAASLVTGFLRSWRAGDRHVDRDRANPGRAARWSACLASMDASRYRDHRY